MRCLISTEPLARPETRQPECESGAGVIIGSRGRDWQLARIRPAWAVPPNNAEKRRIPMTTTKNPVDNGVNVEALLGARQALTDAPAAAQFKWRAKCEWLRGTHSQSTVEGFYGLGAEQKHRQKFTFEADHPEVFASEDHGATPVEIVLASLASCLTAGVAAVAQNRGIQLHSVSATLEGGMDIQGILGMDSDVRN